MTNATEVESYRRDFLLRVHPEILKLKSSSTQTRYQQSECASWYNILVKRALFPRLDDSFWDKEDLAFFLDLHNKAVPEGIGPSSYFVRFVKRDFYTEHYRQQPHRGRYEYSQQEFLDFLTALSRSEKTLNSFYGRFGLLYHKYCQRKHQGKAMDDLRDEAEQLVNDFKKARFPLSTGHGPFHSEIVSLKQKMESGVGQTRLPNGRPPTKEKTVRVAKGRLVFEKIPMKVKDLSGNTHETVTERWVEQDWHWGSKSWGGWYGMRNSIRCGDSLDVMWSGGAVLFMKQKGLLEEVFVGLRPCFDHLTWDGQNIWVGTRSDGIWLVDTFGKIVAKIGTESGLPSVNKRILLHPIEPGRIFAVGSFGPHLRAWCAIVEFKKGQASVNVFHEATRVPTDTDNREELENDPTLVFEPYSIHEYQGEEENRRILLIGRDSRAKYDWKIVRRPLEIDLNKMSIRVSTGQISSLRKKSSSYFVSLFPNIEYKGKVYAPGKIWYCIDPKTHEKEKLVDLQLPEPYSSLNHYWVSAHYGLVGWNWDYGFYQIRITDDEHVYGYFHTVVFEDENGPITNPGKLKRIYVDVVHQNKIIHQYKAGRFPYIVKNGRPLLPGTYKATMWLQQGANVKRRKFEPVEVTGDSPEQLVFKVKGRAEVLYCGQVVNAITGKPMEGAFVTVSDIPDLSPLTHEQWIALHKLPANPYLAGRGAATDGRELLLG